MLAVFEQALIAGIGTGAVYALIAYGISLVWSVSRTMNFAHGDILMVSVFVSFVALFMGVSGPGALLLALCVSIGLGVLLQKAVFYPLRKRKGSLTWVLGVVIFGAILRNIGVALFESRSYPAPFAIGGESTFDLPGGAVLRGTYIWVIAICVVAAVLLDLTMTRTAFGRSIRAVAHSRDAAELMGIDSEKVMTSTFALAAVIGTLAGLLMAPLTFISASLGLLITLKGFTAAVLGGIGRGRGALAGGLIVGISEQLLAVSEFTAPQWLAPYLAAGYRDAMTFGILIVVLVVRPQGIFGPRPERFARS